MIKRVHIICEGQTEEMFVNEVLSQHLAEFNVVPIASLVGKPGRKGGLVTTERMEYDVRLRLLQDDKAWCTTLFDFYGLDKDFVGKSEAICKSSFQEKAEIIESALREYILNKTNDGAIRRFFPYVQMYEFEGLLFSDPEKLASGLCSKKLEKDFCLIRKKFNSPEEINDSKETAPSKRILDLMPRYEKPLHGSLAAIEIGLNAIRRECKRFDAWISWLENPILVLR